MIAMRMKNTTNRILAACLLFVLSACGEADAGPREVTAEQWRIVALVGDGHTELWLPQEASGFQRLPIAIGYFGGELYVFAGDQQEQQQRGCARSPVQSPAFDPAQS